MPLRDAVADDLSTIATLIRALAEYERASDEVTFSEADLERSLFGDDPAAHAVLATDEAGTVVGFALWYRTFSTWRGVPGIWLEDLFVLPAHRGQGHGLALLEHLRSRTTGRVEWAVLDWNQTAIDFYRRLGAAPVEGWTRYRW